MATELPPDPDPSDAAQVDPPPDALAVQDQPGPDPSIFLPPLGPVLGPPPQIPVPGPPPMPAPTANDPKQHILAIAALGAMLGLGKQGGAGVGAGLLHAQAQMDAEKQKQYQHAELLQQHQQAQAAVAQRQSDAFYEQRRRELMTALAPFTKDLKTVTSQEQYDKLISDYSGALQAYGFPRATEQWFRQEFKFIPPSSEKIIQRAIDEVVKSEPYKQTTKADPEAWRKFQVQIPVDKAHPKVVSWVPLEQAYRRLGVQQTTDAAGNVSFTPLGKGTEEQNYITEATGAFVEQHGHAPRSAEDNTWIMDRVAARKAKAAELKRPERDPLLGVLEQQRVDEGRRRAEADKEKNAPMGVDSDVQTTMSGRQYLDLGTYQTPTAREKARQEAQQAGIVPVNKEVADGLRAADNARVNFQTILAQIRPYLAKDAQGRILRGPANNLARIFQSNPVLGAFGSWRTAAVQAVQALAEKGMGLRLNLAEINLMLENDIPQATDDWPTAQQRIGNMMTLLDNKEKAALVRDRSTLSTGSGGTYLSTDPNAGQPVRPNAGSNRR